MNLFGRFGLAVHELKTKRPPSTVCVSLNSEGNKMFDSNGWWVNFSAANGARSKREFIYKITDMFFSEDPGFHTDEESAD